MNIQWFRFMSTTSFLILNTVHINFTYPTAIIYYHKNVLEKHTLVHLATITIKSIFIITQIDIHTRVDTYNQKNTILPQRVYVRKALCLSFFHNYLLYSRLFPRKRNFFSDTNFCNKA